jgi:hypothetical protein
VSSQHVEMHIAYNLVFFLGGGDFLKSFSVLKSREIIEVKLNRLYDLWTFPNLFMMLVKILITCSFSAPNLIRKNSVF